MALTPRQAAFVAAYIANPNATKAAIVAGYSHKTADVQGPRLLGNVVVQDALRAANATALQRVQASTNEAVGTAEWIIRQAAETHAEARADGQFGPAVSALALLAKRHPEFRDNVTNIDNRSVSFALPEGTTLEDLRRLRDELK